MSDDPDILVEGGLALRVVQGKGRGVVATRPFARFETLAINAVLAFDPASAAALEATALQHYLFRWPFDPQGAPLDDSPHCAVAFGLLSLVNHGRGDAANATWTCSAVDMTITGLALRDIAEGEEVAWDYWGAEA